MPLIWNPPTDTGTNPRIIHKFGSSTVTTTLGIVSRGNDYQMVQPSAATLLRVKAGDAGDTAAGAGARTINVQGLDANGAEQTDTLTTNGTSAGANGVIEFVRVYRAWVDTSGTYGVSGSPSHIDEIVIENAAGDADWITIPSESLGIGQSEVAAFTVPAGKSAWIAGYDISVDSAKSTNVHLFKREGILDTAAPYKAVREIVRHVGLGSPFRQAYEIPDGPYPPLTDIWAEAKVGASTGEVSVNMEIIIV